VTGVIPATTAVGKTEAYGIILALNIYMSFLFHKRTKTIMKYVWGAVAIMIILSMLLAYSSGTGGV